ncbi:MAG: exo-alpha-sialidase [Phycisphaeraceae bacterium]
MSLLTLFIGSQIALGGPLEQTVVYERGQFGYNTFRIPAIVQATDGSLLAFAEGRKNSHLDNGNIDLVLRRSHNGGQTWGPLQIVYSFGNQEAGNPAPVVDQSTGNIILPLVLDRQNPAVTISSDHGATWSPIVDITATAKLPTWNGYAFGPVHGIQLERGDHAGRLIIPGNHTLLNQNLNPAGREAHLVYSDDGGSTWQVGGILTNTNGGINPNESTVVELIDGTVHLNTRNQGGAFKRRLIGTSLDAGESFIGPAEVEDQLIDPTIQASLLRYSATDQGDSENRILFSNPAREDARKKMTIKSSFDETQTWDAGKLLHRGPSGYGDLVRTPTGGGLLYENGDGVYYERITYAAFDDDWIRNPTLLEVDFDQQTAMDLRGNGLIGSIEGLPEFVTGRTGSGEPGKAIRFDGQDDLVRYVDPGDHLLDFDGSDSFTIEVVFRTDEHGSGGSVDSGPLIGKDVGPSKPSYWLRVQDGIIRFFAEDGSNVLVLDSPTGVNDDRWHHVAVTINKSSNLASLYLDGELVDSVTNNVGSIANGNDLLIGSFNTGAPGSRRFIGDIDAVRFSDRSLEQNELLMLGLEGDFNTDGILSQADLDIFYDNASGIDFDLNGDSLVDQSDLYFWVDSLFGTAVGDANLDGSVDLIDLSLLAANFGSSLAQWNQGDFDLSFGVNLIDLSLLAANFGNIAPAVPEPIGPIIWLGGVALWRYRLSDSSTRQTKRA